MIITLSGFSEFLQQVYDFLISAEFQAIVTTVLGIGTTIALIANRVAALKMAHATNVQMKQNIEISDLKADIKKLERSNGELKNIVVQQSAMFSLAFLNSKKLDGNTKQEIARIAANLTTKSTQAQEPIKDISATIEKAVEVAKKIIDTPIEPIIDAGKTIFDKLTKF